MTLTDLPLVLLFLFLFLTWRALVRIGKALERIANKPEPIDEDALRQAIAQARPLSNDLGEKARELASVYEQIVRHKP